MKDRDISVLLAVPTLGWVKTELTQRIWDDHHCDPRVRYRAISNMCDVAYARNMLTLQHFNDIEFSHICMVDADTVPPAGFLNRMLALDAPVVSAVTHTFRNKEVNKSAPPAANWAVWGMYEEENPLDGTTEVHFDKVKELPRYGGAWDTGKLATGCFCMLIRAEVIVELAKNGPPLFKTEYVEQTQEKKLSEDLYFCKRLWKELGIGVTVLCDVVCQHHKLIDLSQVRLLQESYQF